MRLARTERRDLVISMTLAEIFMLLLFVIGSGVFDNSVPREIAALVAQNERLKQENDDLKKKVEEVSAENEDLKKRLEMWRNLTGFDRPPSPNEWQTWIKDAGRGNPPCQENNVLIHAAVVNGQISMKLVSESPSLSDWLRESRLTMPEQGVEITDTTVIKSFLELVREYYVSRKKEGVDCRFDYNLSYSTKEDYYDGRQLFEHYFYPSKVSKVQDN